MPVDQVPDPCVAVTQPAKPAVHHKAVHKHLVTGTPVHKVVHKKPAAKPVVKHKPLCAPPRGVDLSAPLTPIQTALGLPVAPPELPSSPVPDTPEATPETTPVAWLPPGASYWWVPAVGFVGVPSSLEVPTNYVPRPEEGGPARPVPTIVPPPYTPPQTTPPVELPPPISGPLPPGYTTPPIIYLPPEIGTPIPAVPEPDSFGLVVIGLLVLIGLSRRRMT